MDRTILRPYHSEYSSRNADGFWWIAKSKKAFTQGIYPRPISAQLCPIQWRVVKKTMRKIEL